MLADLNLRFGRINQVNIYDNIYANGCQDFCIELYKYIGFFFFFGGGGGVVLDRVGPSCVKVRIVCVCFMRWIWQSACKQNAAIY